VRAVVDGRRERGWGGGSVGGQLPGATEDWLRLFDRHRVQVAALDVVDDVILLGLLEADERWEMVWRSEGTAILTRRPPD
jgi:hypothetical protein